jgi:signal peptidase I
MIYERLPDWIPDWGKDIIDVLVNVLVIIIVLRLVFRADMLVPLVVVTSESMVHPAGDMSFKTWMTSRGLTESQISEFPMLNGFNMGDMILVNEPKPRLGDIIIFERDLDHLTFQSTDPIIHRAVGVIHFKDHTPISYEGTLDCHNLSTMAGFGQMIRSCQEGRQNCPYTRYPDGGDFKMYITKGDNNEGSDQCNTRMNIAHPVNEAQITGKALLRLPYLGWPKLLLNLIFQILLLPLRLFA